MVKSFDTITFIRINGHWQLYKTSDEQEAFTIYQYEHQDALITEAYYYRFKAPEPYATINEFDDIYYNTDTCEYDSLADIKSGNELLDLLLDVNSSVILLDEGSLI